MKIIEIDLYDYYHLPKEKGYQGILTCYLISKNNEISTSRKVPAMLILPGGGYHFVSFREDEPVAIHLLNEGICAFTLKYTVDVSYPVQVKEGLLALKFINEHTNEFNLRKERIGVMGFSAGAHLTCLISNLNGLNYLENKENINRPYLNVLGYPVVNFTNLKTPNSFYYLTNNNEELAKTLDLKKIINNLSPKAFIFSTCDDGLVDISNTINLISLYKKYNVPFEVHIFNEGEHGMSLSNINVYHETRLNEIKKINSIWLKLLNDYFLKNDFVIKD